MAGPQSLRNNLGMTDYVAVIQQEATMHCQLTLHAPVGLQAQF